MEIIKRDGRKVQFNKKKIERAILAAFKQVDGEISEYAEKKAENISNYIEDIATEKKLGVEDIQDLVEKGLMSTKRKDVAKAYILYREERNQARGNITDKTITDFLYSVIDSNSFSDFMCSHVTGSTGSRQRTTPSDTLSYELILPSEDELTEFQSLVSPMYAQIRINAIENDRLKRLRDSLLPKLMSGEIDVSTIQL